MTIQIEQMIRAVVMTVQHEPAGGGPASESLSENYKKIQIESSTCLSQMLENHPIKFSVHFISKIHDNMTKDASVNLVS